MQSLSLTRLLRGRGAPFRGKAVAVDELRIHFIGDVKRESKRSDSEEKKNTYRCIFNLLFYDSFRYKSSYRAEGVYLFVMFIPFDETRFAIEDPSDQHL